MKPLIAAAVAALALPATAPAHVTVDPREAPAGGFATLDVRVPNEHADKSTVKVDLRLPDGVYFLWYRKVPGWKVKLTRKPLDTPIDFGGVPVSEHITRIVWTGKRKRGGTIGPDKYEESRSTCGSPTASPATSSRSRRSNPTATARARRGPAARAPTTRRRGSRSRLRTKAERSFPRCRLSSGSAARRSPAPTTATRRPRPQPSPQTAGFARATSSKSATTVSS